MRRKGPPLSPRLSPQERRQRRRDRNKGYWTGLPQITPQKNDDTASLDPGLPELTIIHLTAELKPGLCQICSIIDFKAVFNSPHLIQNGSSVSLISLRDCILKQDCNCCRLLSSLLIAKDHGSQGNYEVEMISSIYNMIGIKPPIPKELQKQDYIALRLQPVPLPGYLIPESYYPALCFRTLHQKSFPKG